MKSPSEIILHGLSMRIEHRIKRTICEEFHLPRYLLQPETIFKEDLGFDEFDMLFLSLALEEEFEFMLTENLQVKEMRDLVKLVLMKVRK
ncbi:MAG: acyl carrier protein [Bacteroidota bacterium]